jgi:hypothetical protein
VIDSETGDVNVTEHIKEGGLFDVKAIAEIDGKNIEETATVSHWATGGCIGA